MINGQHYGNTKMKLFKILIIEAKQASIIWERGSCLKK